MSPWNFHVKWIITLFIFYHIFILFQTLTSAYLNNFQLNIDILHTTVMMMLVVLTLMGLIIAPAIRDTLAMESNVLVGGDLTID